MGWSADDVSSAVAFSRVSRGVDDVHTSTGVACAIFPTSSSACIILLMRAATGFFFGGILLGHSGGRYERATLLPNYFLAGEQATANSPRAGDHSPLRAISKRVRSDSLHSSSRGGVDLGPHHPRDTRLRCRHQSRSCPSTRSRVRKETARRCALPFHDAFFSFTLPHHRLTPRRPQVVVRAERAADFPEETSTAERDETGHVAWQAMPILCHFILSPAGQKLLESARVVELGAGIGVPGLLAGRSCAELVLTDSNDAVVERLRRNIQLNGVEMRCHPDATRVANVAWGADAFPPPTVAARGGFDVVLGSDVVYSASSARTFLETAEGLMAKPGGVTVLAYIPRWPTVDRALHDALRDAGLLAESVALASFLAEKDAAAPDGHALPKGACLLLVRRKDDPSAVSAMSHAAFPTPPPEIEACSGDEGDVVVVRVGPEHVSDLVETFRGAAIDESLPATVSLRFDATGPFAVSPAQVASLAEALRSPPLVGRVSELWLDECWLGREGWSTLAPVAREGADAFTSIRAVGDEIDEVAAAHVAVTLEKCTNLRSLCLARNPMGDAGAVALAPGLAACASLTALTVSRCGIGDAGAAAVARALPSTLIALDASSNEMTSLGLGHLAAEIRAGRTPSLTRLNLSGNDVGPGGGAELAEALPTGAPKLEALDLRGCFLADSGVSWLAPALPKCECLTTLHLGSNGAGDSAAAALAAALPDCPRLEELGLAMNSITGDGVWELVEGLAECIALSRLDLKGNGIGDEGVSAIADVLADVPTLREVIMSNNDVGEEGAIALAECFGQKRLTPWADGLVLVLESNPDVAGAGRTSLEAAASRVGIHLKFSGAKVNTTGYGR